MKTNLLSGVVEAPGGMKSRQLLFSAGARVRKVASVPEAALEADLKSGVELVVVPIERLRTVARLADEMSKTTALHPEVTFERLVRIGALIDASIKHATGGEYEGAPAPVERDEDLRRRFSAYLQDIGREAVRAGLPGLGAALVSLAGATVLGYEEDSARVLIVAATDRERKQTL